MALKIFISSVFNELKAERQALEEEIHKLQDLFIGMEYFGSDPNKPAKYCEERVQESDLYVGLFGEDYGSIDDASNKSFTELEYDAAISSQIPCLIYFKSTKRKTGKKRKNKIDLKLDELKAKLLKDHIVYTFFGINDLKLQFLVDVIKLLRGSLLGKIGSYQQNYISVEALHALTRGLNREQIKAVAQNKYISKVYIERKAEDEIYRFVNFEDTFLKRSATVLESLSKISKDYRLDKDTLPILTKARSTMKDLENMHSISEIIDAIKRAFFFDESENILDSIFSIINDTTDKQFDVAVKELVLKIAALPFARQNSLIELPKDLHELRSRKAAGKSPSREDVKELRIVPSLRNEEGGIESAPDLIKALTHLVKLQSQRCFAIVAQAGHGKTNLICRLAEKLVESHPTILLSGQMEVTSEYDIEFHIQRRLESEFQGIFSDWMNRVSPGLKTVHKWLFILIDGINENSNLPLLIRLFKNLLPKLENKRIKLIVSCRDFLWEAFSPSLAPFLFEEKTSNLEEFSQSEWQRATHLYFNQFNIEAKLSQKAEVALKNPLLLRFFCEANQGRQLGEVKDVRLLSVFDLYLDRVNKNIAERLGFIGADSVVGFLIKISSQMWSTRKTSLDLSKLDINPIESSNVTSIYNLVRSENVILEDIAHTYATEKTVRFLYDEFMEYMIARSWVNQLSELDLSNEAIDYLLQEAVAAIISFSPAFGAILFLDKMLERNGALVNRAITLLSSTEDVFVESRQMIMLNAFDNINVANADDELISVLDKFENMARDEIKEKLAPVILRILQKQPAHYILRGIVIRMLEIDLREKPDLATTQSELRNTLRMPKSGKKTPKSKLKSKKKGDKSIETFVPRLPAARYHYTEETKINAIGILIGVKNSGDFKLVEEGIKNLGRMELHSALQALASLDRAEDDLVYKMISRYIATNLTEYRIYCGWLLRERYGKEPAKNLLTLLMDDKTRVHRYAFGLFKERFIESELVEGILERTSNDKEISSWHLAYMVKLLGRRSQFLSEDIISSHGKRITRVLNQLSEHRQASLRVEVYRALLAYEELIDSQSIVDTLLQENDIYIRQIADNLLTKK